jgi:hypothetical protein
MRMKLLAIISFGIVASASSALAAGDPSEPNADDAFESAASIGRKESKLVVVPRDQVKAIGNAEPRPSDEPVRVNLPLLSPQHRDEGLPYMDPVFGLAIYPQIGARLLTGFVNERFSNSGETSSTDSRMAIASRVDLSLWALDLRVPFDTQGGPVNDPMEIALKIPFGIGRHRFAPIFSVFTPIGASLQSSLVEAGLGYHVTLFGIGLRLEATGYNGSFDRFKNVGRTSGMLGWNGALSYLIGEHVGVMFEADGVTALSEATAGATAAKRGDTVVRLVPAIRFFPNDSSFRIGVAGQYTIVPDGYDIVRRRGVLLDLGYVFL